MHKAIYLDVPVIGLDPGTKEYGFGIVKLNQLRQPKIYACGKLIRPMQSLLGDVEKEGVKFERQIKKLLRHKHKTKALGAERYQTRSVKGKTGELVSHMNALTIKQCSRRKIKAVLLIASTWKNAWHRQFPRQDLDKVYLKVTKLLLGKEVSKAAVKRSSHFIDAVLIAIFIANGQTFKGLKLSKQFWSGFRNELRIK